MDARERYAAWCQREMADADLTADLLALAGQEKEIYERFYQDLSFGTAGLRGILGAGTNRMNYYTVRRATQGLANYLQKSCEHCSCAIAFDSRHKSELFAKEAAKVLAGNGVKVFFYETLTPTPMLSWAVRYHHCSAGINITASHNPSEYNGYKAYGPDGCQMTETAANAVLAEMQATDLFTGTKNADFDAAVERGDIIIIGAETVGAYEHEVLACSPMPELLRESDLSVVYTPLNGTGNLPVRRLLEKVGVKNLHLVEEQLLPDGSFPTCPYPNPEMPEAMALAMAKAKTVDADLLIGTDPDADRLGVGVRHHGEYRLLSGNDVGVLMLDYLARALTETGRLPARPVLIKSIVTTTLADAVAKSYGMEVYNVLTGFKNIGDRIAKLEAAGEGDRFVFAYEESCGYLPRAYVRDKDAIVAAMLACEMAAYHKKQGRTLIDALDALYQRFGAFCNRVTSTLFPGADGMRAMAEMMETLFAAPPVALGDLQVVATDNYRDHIHRENGVETAIELPASSVLGLRLSDGSSVLIRPSGTEPKLKVYYMVQGKTMEAARETCQKLETAVTALLGLA